MCTQLSFQLRDKWPFLQSPRPPCLTQWHLPDACSGATRYLGFFLLAPQATQPSEGKSTGLFACPTSRPCKSLGFSPTPGQVALCNPPGPQEAVQSQIQLVAACKSLQNPKAWKGPGALPAGSGASRGELAQDAPQAKKCPWARRATVPGGAGV